MATSFIHSTNSYRKSALCQVPCWTLGCELNTADTPLSPGAPILVEETGMEKWVQGSALVRASKNSQAVVGSSSKYRPMVLGGGGDGKETSGIIMESSLFTI